MKTKVIVRKETHQCPFKEGDIGYIDGYVHAADNKPYAVVVCGPVIDFVPVWALNAVTDS